MFIKALNAHQKAAVDIYCYGMKKFIILVELVALLEYCQIPEEFKLL